MKIYRLKKVAVQFFDSKYSDKVKPMLWWEENKVNHNALEEVKCVWVDLGIDEGGPIKKLTGWSSKGDHGENQVKLHFTLNALDIDHDIYRELRSDKKMVVLAREIENVFSNHIEFLKKDKR